ncbi:MAG: ABC transporter permease [Candidatus Bathyarchaeia archaeon]
MFEYSELIRHLAVKEFKLRYRNSALGFLWSLLNPLAMMIILTIVFSALLRTSIEKFPVFLLTALLVWRFFSIASSMALWSIIGNSSLVTKVYFPRWLLVLSSNLANLIGSSLEFIALFPLLIFLGMKLTFLTLLLPLILVIEFILIMGVSLPLSALNVYYRDVSQIWDLALQAGFFLCPIVYDIKLIPENYLFLYLLNPMTRIIQSVRKILYYNTLPTLSDFAIPLLSGLLLLLVGYIIFHKLEPKFAEEL